MDESAHSYRPNSGDATPRQRRAMKYEAFIRARLTRMEKDWHAVKRYIAVVHDEKLYEEWDLSFEEWLAEIDISRSLGFDLVKMAHSPFSGLLDTLPVSKARLMLPHLTTEHGDPLTWDQAERLMESARGMKYEDLREELAERDDAAPRWVVVTCPSCHRELRASRAVNLEPK